MGPIEDVDPTSDYSVPTLAISQRGQELAVGYDDPFQRTSPGACGIGVLPFSIQGGGDPCDGWGRRVVDNLPRKGKRERAWYPNDGFLGRDSVSRFSRNALLGLYVISRIQSELW